MSMTISAEALAQYRATARSREQARARAVAARRQRAWQVVEQAAELLKKQFGATRVAVFGSLVHDGRFGMTSDIDMAVWDVTGEDYLVAVARMQDLDRDFKIDLISMQYCKPRLAETIRREGMEL
jgi:predicted nucleotidyltransferase